MLIVTAIPYRTFKDKLKIVKAHQKNNVKIEVLDKIIYIEQYVKEV